MEILMKILMKWLKIIASKVKITDKSQKRVHVTDRMSDGHVNTKVRKEIARGVRKFMEKNYELRYNIMKQTEEFRQKASYGNYSMSNSRQKASNCNYSMSNSENNATFSDEKTGKWKPLTDRELRRIALEQMEQVGVAWSIDVELYVRSALVRDYNPVADFLGGCPPWDGCDRIRPLARRVPTLCDDWPEWFHRWFLAVVAQWQQRSRDYGNSVVPMLIGAQGTEPL